MVAIVKEANLLQQVWKVEKETLFQGYLLESL